MWNGFEGMGAWWVGVAALHTAVFWALVILAFAALLKWLGAGAGGDASAIDILKARYAKGELTREQFEQLKRELGA